MRRKLHMGRAVLILALLVISGFTFFIVVGTKQECVQSSKPFFHHVDEIAADGESFYTLDGTFNYICKYSNDGRFEYAISFSYLSSSYIYVDENGSLCLYLLGQDELHVYDSNGNKIDVKPLSDEEFEEIRSSLPITSLSVDGVRYRFKNRTLFDSEVQIVTEQGERCVVVESVWSHLVWILMILLFLAGFSYFMWTFFCFFFREFYPKQKAGSK